MNDECIMNWLKDIKRHCLHPNGTNSDDTRALAIDKAIERLNSQQDEINRLNASFDAIYEWVEGKMKEKQKEKGTDDWDYGFYACLVTIKNHINDKRKSNCME